MSFGICLLSAVPARKEPSGTSEMVTQLLFGEHYKVVEIREDWMRIITGPDAYECWISEKQHHKISENTYTALSREKAMIAADLIHPVRNQGLGSNFPITLGAILPFMKNGKIRFDNYEFAYDGASYPNKTKGNADQILSTAYLFLNAPYLWGGRTPLGIDCSGFSQLVYRLNGYMLPRDSAQQVEIGTPLSFVEEANPGDLAFFDNEEGKIVHVGIIIDQNRIIHASGSVRIDHYDHFGVFHSEKKKYSHHLRVIKRLLD